MVNKPNIDRYGIAPCTSALQGSCERGPNGSWDTWGPFWREISGCRRFQYSTIPCHDKGHKSCGLGVRKTFKIYSKSTPKESQGAHVLPLNWATAARNGSQSDLNWAKRPYPRAGHKNGVVRPTRQGAEGAKTLRFPWFFQFFRTV